MTEHNTTHKNTPSSAGRWAVLAAFVLAVAAAAGVQWAGGLTTTSAPAPTDDGPRRTSKQAEFLGMTLQLHHGADTEQYDGMIDEIVANCTANTIQLTVFGYQENCQSSSIFIDQRRTPGRAHLKRLIQHAQNKGLKVTLMPIVLLENPGQSEWRGKIDPKEKWAAWWEDYDNFILYYAQIAQESGVDMLMIGSELISTEKRTDDWRSLIGQVRQVFKGHLAYSANWDHYEVPEFWDDLDLIGMTTYYELASKDAKPTVDELKAKWATIRANILKWQAKIKRPIIFTEVGWPNQVSAAWAPWNYYHSTDKPDPELQARCFQAFFETWENDPEVAGFLVWEWRQGPDDVDGDPKKDTTYVPYNKPAMKVINDFFTKMSKRPVAESRPTTDAAGNRQ
ncbi:MAG: hypothetical protein FWE88_07740 [Phycisphaerae bacterium]|nr:hypothetical protein [Phycisphaerae bacterium]